MVDATCSVFAGLLLLGGTLGDRHGRKRALQAGLVVFGLASAAALFATTGGHVIAARAVMGLGAALVMPATLSIIIDVFPARSVRRRSAPGRAWPRSARAWAGHRRRPPGGGRLAVGLRPEPPRGRARAAPRHALVPESRDPAPGRLDVAGAALSIAGLGALVYTIIEAPSHGWTSGTTLTGFAVAAVLGAAFAARERRAPDPLLDLRLFRRPAFSLGSLAVAASFFALFGMVFALTQFLQLVQGATPLEAGLKQMPVALGLVLSAPVSAVVAARLGARRVVAGAMAVLAVALAGVVTWTPETGR
jgi:predicted MFS family arabinose efflux permease